MSFGRYVALLSRQNAAVCLPLAVSVVLFATISFRTCAQNSAGPSHPEQASNPVLPGDHPDPSIIRVGKTYWTTSTSGDWSPQFPLFSSTDLKHWASSGAIFPHQPTWATGSFWAPELVSDRGAILVYYVGRKRDGPLCVAVATAPHPAGPYTDHGPIECQPDGSIDPAFARDESGKPFLIWKEDGNSIHKPTPLWAQPLTSDRLHLTGEKVELLVNDPDSWEGGVVEAPYVLRHNGHFYLFYAGNACCGTACNYAEGVARADHLLGPYEKDPANPIIHANSMWKCPGHGSAVTTAAGRDFFIYHAYPTTGSIYLGRESVLDRIDWASTGWPTINNGRGPGEGSSPSLTPALTKSFPAIIDDFSDSFLNAAWQWPVNHQPTFRIASRSLVFRVAQNASEDYVARALSASDYVSSILVEPHGLGLGSLAVIGNAEHASGLGRSGSTLELWKKDGPTRRIQLWHGEVTPSAPIYVRVISTQDGKRLNYSYSSDDRHWISAGDSIDVSGLPQWDQGLRVGLDVQGPPGSTATFRHFSFQRNR